jgi:hypothetical protein
VSVADFEAWQEQMPSVSFVAVKDRVEALRMVKDKGEIAAIREAVDFAERAFAMLRARPAPRGDREGHGRCAGGLPQALRRVGGQLPADRRRRRTGRPPPRPPHVDDPDRRR